MSGAVQAETALCAAALVGAARCQTATAGLEAAIQAVIAADDLTPALQACAALTLAAEAVAAAAAELHEASRAALVRAMDETGATGFRTTHHAVALVQTPRKAVVTDRAALPERFMRQPPPAPDLAALAKALRGGEAVSGATLSNGGVTVRFTSNEG